MSKHNNEISHLRPATREWYTSVLAAYDLESHHLKLLRLAAEAWDRTQMAREVIDREGLTFTDSGGFPKPRPEVAIERDARIGFARLIRELRLDVASPGENDIRPPRISSYGLPRSVKHA